MLEINPFYFKKGDDFANFLEKTETVQEAISIWGQIMEKDGKRLQELSRALENKIIDGEGCTHVAYINGLTREEENDFLAMFDDVLYRFECEEE